MTCTCTNSEITKFWYATQVLLQGWPMTCERMHARTHVRTHARVCVCVCVCVCMCACMYVCIHMCCVLIRPPIPYITSSRCKRLDKFRPVEILLHKRTHPRPPPYKDIIIYFFKIYEVITSYFFKSFFL
jgi:hypothetical protein